MKILKQKQQRKDFEKKRNLNSNISKKAKKNNKGFVQPYPASHKFTKSKIN